MTALKLCPFCGGMADISRSEGGGLVVGCKSCFISTSWSRDEADSIEKWNKRALEGYYEKSMNYTLGLIKGLQEGSESDGREDVARLMKSLHQIVKDMMDEPSIDQKGEVGE